MDANQIKEAAEDSIDSSPLAAWLNKEMNAKGLTIPELARRSGLSRAAIYKIERGETRNLRDSTRKRLEAGLSSELPQDIAEQIDKESEIVGLGKFEDFQPHTVSDHPTDPGIYVLYDISQRPIYVGQGKNVKKRMKAHAKTKWFIPEIVDSASWIRVEDCDLRRQIEELLIRFLKSNAIINKQHVERQRTRANRAPNGGSKRRYISAKDAAISALKKGPLDIAALYESLSSQGVRSKDERSLRATLNQNDCFECRDGKWRLRKP